jgi:hypothetical protein
MLKLEWSGGAADAGVLLEYRHAIHPTSTIHDVTDEEVFEEDTLKWLVNIIIVPLSGVFTKFLGRSGTHFCRHFSQETSPWVSS